MMTDPICEYCKEPFKPKRRGQKFCVGKNCRQKWHAEQKHPGRVQGISATGSGGWAVTIYLPDLDGLKIHDQVSIEKG